MCVCVCNKVVFRSKFSEYINLILFEAVLLYLSIIWLRILRIALYFIVSAGYIHILNETYYWFP